MNTVQAHPISREAFAPYGWLIDASSHTGLAINDGSSQRVDGQTELALTAAGGQACLAVFKAAARDPAGPWQVLERHSLGTQTFVPLNGVRYVVLVACASQPVSDRPDESTLAAFVVSGHQGITLRAGTWHHGLLALEAGDFVVLERHAAEVDCSTAQLQQPVRIVLG